jgi:hypothetical protein
MAAVLDCISNMQLEQHLQVGSKTCSSGVSSIWKHCYKLPNNTHLTPQRGTTHVERHELANSRQQQQLHWLLVKQPLLLQ